MAQYIFPHASLLLRSPLDDCQIEYNMHACIIARGVDEDSCLFIYLFTFRGTMDLRVLV